MNKKLLPITFSILFIVSCGGGGGGGSTPTPPTTPAPTVNLSAEPTSVLLESTSTLTWSSTNATSCSATWTSQTGTSGSEAVTISTVGNNSFSISCTGAGGTRSASVTVEGYRETDGVVVDGYISGAEVCIDEDESWTCDSNENSTTSDNEGKFTIRYANGNLVSIGGTDLDSQTLLDNLLITHKLTGHSDFKAVTPVTSVAAFMEDASLVNAALGIDSSIDVFTFDPVANKGDGGIYDYLYEKGNQLTVLAFALQNITNNLNTTTETTQDYFKAITEEIEKEYTATETKVDIETQAFVTKALENVIEAKSVTIDETAKANTTKALAGILPVIEVKSSDDLTTAVIRFAVSTLQTDIQAIANGTATAETVTSYTSDILTYIAEDQNVDSGEIAPDINAIADTASTSEDTAVTINVVANDSYLTSAPISITAGNGTNGTTTIAESSPEQLVYTPDADYNGTDTFSYTITQGEKTSSADVTLTIEAVNDAPTIDIASTIQVAENQTAVTTVSVSDVDEDELTLTLGGTDADSFNLSDENVLTYKEAPDYETKSSYSITLSLTDGTETVTKEVTISVTNINDVAPEFTSEAAFSAAENQTTIGTLTATDAEGDDVTFTISGTELAITSAGVLTFVSAPDYETKATYTATVTATDGTNPTTQDITVNVTNVNESPKISGNTVYTIEEDISGLCSGGDTYGSGSCEVFNITAEDPEDDNLTYSISGVDKDGFQVSSAGKVSTTFGPNYENANDLDGDNEYEITINVSDGSLSESKDIVIKVLNTDEVPVLNWGGQSLFINENETVIKKIDASDPENDPITISISGTDSDLITLTDDNILEFINPPDYESEKKTYSFNINLSANGLTNDFSIIVNILNVNDVAPAFTSEATFSTAENQTAIGTVTATDAEGDGITYSISGSDITINSSSGVIAFPSAPDYETKTIYTATVTASDGVNTTTQDITVNITNVNDVAPAFTSEATFSTAENQTAIGTVTATDAEGDEVTFTISGSELEITSAGVLSFASAPDYETKTSYSATVTASDGTNSTAQDITVNVTNINDNSPNFTSSATFTVDENQTAIGTVAASDADGDEIVYSISGSEITINTSSGVITFVSAPDYETKTSYTATVTASDGTNSTAQDITVNVTNINDNAPLFTDRTANPNYSSEENSQGQFLGTLTASDVDGDSFTFSIDDTTTFRIDSNNRLFFRNGTDYESGNTSYTPTITVSDGLNSTSLKLSITILDVNEPITFTSPTSFTVDENTTTIGTITASDPEGDDINIGLASSGNGDDTSLFSINSSNILSLKTAGNYESKSSYQLRVIGWDEGNREQITQTITVNLTNVTEAVAVNDSSSGIEDDNIRVNVLTNDTFISSDVTLTATNGTNMTVEVQNDATSVAEYGHPTIIYSPDANWFGTDTFTYTVSSGGESDQGTVTVTVTSVNDAPTINSSATFSAAENQTAIGTVTATDIEDDTLTYSISGSDISIDSSTGVMTFNSAPDYETTTSYSATVTVSDGTDSDTQDITVNITNVNESPSFTSSAIFSAEENQTSIGTVNVSDPENGTLTYSLTSTDSSLINISDSGVLTFLSEPNYESKDTYSPTVSVSDGTNTATQEITINITDVNDAPVISSNFPSTFTIAENYAAPSSTVASTACSSSRNYLTCSNGTVNIGGSSTISTFSDEDDDSLSISFSGTDQSYFSASAGNSIYLTDDADYETKSSYSANVVLSDGSESVTQAFVLNISNVNDNAPVITSSATFSAAENQTAIGTVKATDADGSSISYSISGGPAADVAVISINSSTGVLSFDTAPNYESKTSYSIEVSAYDGVAETTQDVTITIINVNEAPAFTSSASFSAAENQTTIGSVSVTDPENATLSYSLSGTDASSLAISSSGVLSFGSAPNYESKNSYSATVAASDGTNSTTQDITISVTDVNDAPVATAAAYTMNLKPQSQTSGTLTLAGTDEDGDTLTYSIVSNGSYGTASLSGTTITYQTDASTQSAQSESFTFKVNDGTVDSSAATISISLKTDPLYQYQWHLNNTGQTNFASNAGTSGQDLNIDTDISLGVDGSGVVVAVIDDGLELAHEDLASNILSGYSWDYINLDLDPTPSSSSDNHGTSVAGIIAAEGWNNKGGRGVAPNAQLVGYNLLSNSYTEANSANAMYNTLAVNGDVDIFNMSYGPRTGVSKTYTRVRLTSLEETALINGVTNLRGGKGAIYLASSGNDWRFYDKDRDPDAYVWCGLTLGTSNYAELMPCWDSVFDELTDTPYVMAIASLNAKGLRASYSTPGANVWVSGFGGESGNNISHTGIDYPDAFGDDGPAIMSTDLSTCSRGSVQSGVSAGSGGNNNAFNNADHSENSSCNYNSSFNGTSAAAPTVAGVVALMLEANPSLTWRDVKHILASTSVKVDESRSKSILGVTQYSWVTNAANYKHHNWYGFGKINAGAAIDAAQAYSLGSLGTFIQTDWVQSGTLNAAIPSLTASTTSLNVSAPTGATGKVEFVRINIALTHDRIYDLGLRLTSPDGTTVNIMTPFTIIETNPNGTSFDIGVNAFYGENISGTWTLGLDEYTDDSVDGVLNNWAITVYGH